MTGVEGDIGPIGRAVRVATHAQAEEILTLLRGAEGLSGGTNPNGGEAMSAGWRFLAYVGLAQSVFWSAIGVDQGLPLPFWSGFFGAPAMAACLAYDDYKRSRAA